MIPKIIHYCWFGRKEKPKDVLEYIETWKKHLPDFQIKEWNEDNFNINQFEYTKEAYYAKKYYEIYREPNRGPLSEIKQNLKKHVNEE